MTHNPIKSKNLVSDLAIFGGKPEFSNKLHVGRPHVGNRQELLDRINVILDRYCFTNDGPYVKEFEKNICDFLGVKHCIATCNGTQAMMIAIKALELSGEVITPSFTFIAAPHSLSWLGIKPVFCDIDLHNHTLDPSKIIGKITSETSAIIPVHLWGIPCDTDSLKEISRSYDLKLIYDAAHAFGSSCNGTLIGNFGDAEIFSFHATKFINSFEGGAITTNNDELASKAKLYRNFGFEDLDKSTHIGINAKMTEVCAAMGITSLESLYDLVSINHSNYLHYKDQFNGLPGIKILEYPEYEKCNYQYVVIEIDEELTVLTRDDIKDILWAENILARRYFYPGCHMMECYKSDPLLKSTDLPNTEKIAGKVLCLPTGISIRIDDITKICDIIKFTIDHAHEIIKRL